MLHGEYSFLVERTHLARERAGVLFTKVRQGCSQHVLTLLSKDVSVLLAQDAVL